MDYIKRHQSWPGTICKVCGKEDRGPYYEIYKKGRWTFICKGCVDEISLVNQNQKLVLQLIRSSYGCKRLACKG